MDLEPILAYARELVRAEAQTRVQLRAAIQQRWPAEDADSLSAVMTCLLPSVQVPPRGVWGTNGPPALTTIESWLGRPLDSTPSIERMVLRYLAAFGPATVNDIQTWCGLTRLREVVDRLRPSLRVFHTEDGSELYDLPDAPRPDPETEAPPRFLPEYDNVLLSHKDRRRIMPEGRRVPLPPGTGAAAGTLLLDGWFEPLSPDAVAAVEAEGRALVRFVGGEHGEVRFGP